MDPEPAPEITSPQPGRSWLGYIVAGLLLVVVAIIVLIVKTGSNDKISTVDRPTKPTFTNPLTPTSELKVGNARYISPCQALTLSDVTRIYSTTNDSSYVNEDALAVSVPVSDHESRYDTGCTYHLAHATVTLRADQYSDPKVGKRVSTLFLDYSDKYQGTIDGMKKAVAGSSTQDAKDLVTTIEKSYAKYSQFKSQYDDEALAKQNFDGMVLPDLLGEGVQMLQGNTLYTLSYGSKDIKDPRTSPAALDKLARGLKLVTKNIKNPHLDQSPINPILGSSNRIGTTKVLEPCAVLTTDMFKSLTGTDENGLMRRATLPYNIMKSRFDDKVHKTIVMSNDCERNRDDDSGTTAVSNNKVELQLYQAANEAQAKQYVIDYADDPSAPPTPLQTDADEANVYGNSLQSDNLLYLFRVGPYIGLLSIETSGSQSLADDVHFNYASQDQYVQAINALTAQIKKLQ